MATYFVYLCMSTFSKLLQVTTASLCSQQVEASQKKDLRSSYVENVVTILLQLPREDKNSCMRGTEILHVYEHHVHSLFST